MLDEPCVAHPLLSTIPVSINVRLINENHTYPATVQQKQQILPSSFPMSWRESFQATAPQCCLVYLLYLSGVVCSAVDLDRCPGDQDRYLQANKSSSPTARPYDCDARTPLRTRLVDGPQSASLGQSQVVRSVWPEKQSTDCFKFQPRQD